MRLTLEVDPFTPLDEVSDFDSYLDQVIRWEGPEFTLVPNPTSSLVSQLMMAGHLMMAHHTGDEELLFAKFHHTRMGLDPRTVVSGKSVRRKSKNYQLTVDKDFSAVVQGCIDTHGDGWLQSGLVSTLHQLRKDKANLRPLSVELWREGDLVAGEFGILCGSCYTSYSGFTNESGAGTVQLHALARLFALHQVRLWDLGMFVEYKLHLGAQAWERDCFIKNFREAREQGIPASLLEIEEAIPAADLIARA